MAGRVITAVVDASLKTGAAKSHYLRDFDNFRQCVNRRRNPLPFSICPGRRSTLP